MVCIGIQCEVKGETESTNGLPRQNLRPTQLTINRESVPYVSTVVDRS